MTNSDLCNMFGVAVYVVSDIYDTDRNGKPIEPADLSKWFVSTLKDGFADEVVAAIPLADTRDEAEANAVKHLELTELLGITERYEKAASDQPDSE